MSSHKNPAPFQFDTVPCSAGVTNPHGVKVLLTQGGGRGGDSSVRYTSVPARYTSSPNSHQYWCNSSRLTPSWLLSPAIIAGPPGSTNSCHWCTQWLLPRVQFPIKLLGTQVQHSIVWYLFVAVMHYDALRHCTWYSVPGDAGYIFFWHPSALLWRGSLVSSETMLMVVRTIRYMCDGEPQCL